ncbi:hypothetical protein V6Z11_D11G232600 [Gossypium hirsutum]
MLQEKDDSLAEGCFTFGNVDLVLTIEEYVVLLRCSKFQVDRVYSRAVNVPTFSKKLIGITGMSEYKCIPWRSLKDAILTHPDVRKRLDIFALSIYGLVVFPKALGHVDEAVTDLFDRLDKKVTPIPVILAETFRSLSACRKTGEGRFIGCVQLLLVWFHSHFWKVDKVSYRVFSENYSPLKEIVATSRRDDISEEKWMAILQNLQEEDVEWRAPWLLPDEILYRCGNFDWVLLLGIWGAVGYAPLLVLRKKIQEMSNAWKQTRRMKRLAVGPMITPEYYGWWTGKINDNTPKLNHEDGQSIEERLRVIPSELEIVRQDFERKNAELEKRIEQMEAKKTNLRLDIDVQKLENERLKKEKNKVDKELGSLKTDYKKLRLSIRTAGLGKTSEQWRRFQEMQRRNEALKKNLSEIQKEKGELKDRVIVLDRSRRQYRSRNSTIELKASLSKIDEIKKIIEELETVLQNCEIQIKHLKANESRNNGQLHHFQSQVRSRDHLMEEAVVQIREVADYV